MEEKQILFTFDYELFLGSKSGSVKNCMLEPTKNVVAILNKNNVKGIFFVDCSYLFRLEKIVKNNVNAKNDYQSIKSQLESLIEQGHYIYPHIHPHWIDAKYLSDLNEWNLSNNSKYRINSLGIEERSNHFYNAMKALNNILNDVNLHYKIDAYRAGGWCIQPFDIFAPLFDKHKITTDFSVLGEAEKDGNTLSYNFNDINYNSSPYRFDSNINQKSEEGKYKEFPISSILIDKSKFVNKLINKILWKIPYGRNKGNGIGAAFKSFKDSPSSYDLSKEMVSIELLTINKLNTYNRYLSKNSYMQFISHPKMISQHNLDTLSRFLKKAKANYIIESDWRKIKL